MDYEAFFNRCNFSRRPGADETALDQLAATFRCALPSDFRELWLWSDGGNGDAIRFLPLSDIGEYKSDWWRDFGYVPFGDCNDSNPYVLSCREPIYDVVVHVNHDGDTRLICRGLSRFGELLAQAIARNDDVDRLPGDWPMELAPRSPADAEVARRLLNAAVALDDGDEWRQQALDFAVQLLGPGDEADLATALAAGNEYNRDTVLERCAHLQTSAARQLLAKDSADYREFVASFEQALNLAGQRTERDRNGQLRLQSRGGGLNLRMLYCDCRRPSAMDEWVARIAARS